MRCPFCAYQEDRVIDSRLIRDGRAIRRRRHCEGCEKRYTTYETIDEGTPVIVKKDGRREKFDRQKLMSGIVRACEKRPVSMTQVETFLDQLEGRLGERTAHEIPSSKLGEEVIDFLRSADPIAYIRFASVYRSFHDLHQFIDEIRELSEANPPTTE
jgi:transcriptional repressor NrdR